MMIFELIFEVMNEYLSFLQDTVGKNENFLPSKKLKNLENTLMRQLPATLRNSALEVISNIETRAIGFIKHSAEALSDEEWQDLGSNIRELLKMLATSGR